MAELLTAARPVRRSAKSSANGSSRGDRLDYATREHAGKPHKGKITDTEKQLVRDHLDEINERLAAQGLRAISLTDPEHVERYGLQEWPGSATWSSSSGSATRPAPRPGWTPRSRDADNPPTVPGQPEQPGTEMTAGVRDPRGSPVHPGASQGRGTGVRACAGASRDRSVR